MLDKNRISEGQQHTQVTYCEDSACVHLLFSIIETKIGAKSGENSAKYADEIWPHPAPSQLSRTEGM